MSLSASEAESTVTILNDLQNVIHRSIEIILLLWDDRYEWDILCTQAVVDWRNAVNNFYNSVVTVGTEWADIATDSLSIIIWMLDLAIVPSWFRQVFVDAFDQVQTRGRPRRFQEYIPLIRCMIEDLDYTNRAVRTTMRIFGVDISARQLRTIIQNERINRSRIRCRNVNDVAAIIHHERFESGLMAHLTYGEGLVAIQGRLFNGYGLNVSIPVIRQALQIVDPGGVEWRRRRVRPRRVYHCLCPYEMFHLDACCKLVKWKIYFHGCIDGFSHLVVYIKAAGKNDAVTLQLIFERECIRTVGRFPYHIRTDRGSENNGPMRAMRASQFGSNPKAVLRGPSTKNVRIERLWLTLGMQKISVWKAFFESMETYMGLDASNDIHLWCLHYVFMGRINRELEIWRLRINDTRHTSQCYSYCK